jgi:hypothetical protein
MHESLGVVMDRILGDMALDTIPCLVGSFLESGNSPVVKGFSHPLGFLYSPLFAADGAALRLHVWHPSLSITDVSSWQIHTHEYYLASYVLCGSVINTVYEVEPDSVSPTHRVYKVSYENGESALRPSHELVSCDVKQQNRFDAGRRYEVLPNEFHRTTVPKNCLVATLVAVRPSVQHSPRVLGDLVPMRKQSTNRRPMESAGVERVLSMVLRECRKLKHSTATNGTRTTKRTG